MSSSGLSGSAARGGAVTMLAQAARIIIQMLQVFILARLIAPESYGLVAMATAFTGIAGILRDFGLSTAALRRVDLSAQQRTNLFWLNTASGVVLAGIIFALSWPIAAFYGETELVTLVQWVSLAYVMSGATTQFRVAISRDLRFRALAMCDVLPSIVALLLAVPVALAGYSLAALVVLQLALPATDLLCSAILARWRPGLPRRAPGMRDLLSFGVSFAFTQLLSYATRNVDTVIIGRLWGASPLGLYNRAFQLSVVPINQINAPMTKVALPVLARVVDEPERLMRGLRSAQLVACYLTATGLCIAAGLSEPLIEVLLGPGWSGAAPLFAILALSSVFRSIQQIANWLQVAKGSARSLLMSNLIGQPVIILLIALGIPWGVVGVAAGSVIGYAAFWVFSMLWAGKHTGVPTVPLMARATRIVGCVGVPSGLAAYATCWLSPWEAFPTLLLGAAASCVALAASYLSSRRTRVELKALASLVRKSLGRRGKPL
ncbi:lipopolysaccharide biosynthesis protein [Microbacterium sp. JZ37]|uniref:lipopolysaccharide biosynthesis protein n=1 Tax=Microbacterium sp. JZ37 TaxID=2654193 RepID=UPI002B4A8439|nr:lipopolysaccharide biosynthesis protein [Microbacterium sp. JZ37]WRH18250.1 oligosaccharide flippase family protein [Microbacterium sp. JZ37]